MVMLFAMTLMKGLGFLRLLTTQDISSSVPAGSPFTALRNGDPAALAALNYRRARSGDPPGTVKKCSPGSLYFVFVITQKADEL